MVLKEINTYFNKIIKEQNVAKYIYACFFSMLLFDYFAIIPTVKQSYPMLFFLILLQCWGLYYCEKENFALKNKNSLIYNIFLILISCYLAFSMNGIWLFWNEVGVDFTLSNISQYILTVIWFLPIVKGSWEFLYNMAYKTVWKEKNKSFLIPFLIFIMGFGLYLIAYNPLLSAADVFVQLQQVVNGKYESHALIHTLFLSGVWRVTGNIIAVSIVQFIFWLTVIFVAERFLRFYRLGKIRIVFYLWLAFNLLNGIMLMNIWKDTLFTCSFLLMVVICGAASTDKTVMQKNIWNILLCVSIVLVWLTRLNGALSVISIIFFLLSIIINKKPFTNWKTLISLVLALGIIVFFKTEVEDFYKYHEFDEGRISIRLMHTMASIVATDGFESLDEETRSLFEKVCDEKTWKENYDPFDTDQYSFRTTQWLDKINILDSKDVTRVFIKNFLRKPLTLGMARLCASESMWNIVQPETSFNYIYDRILFEEYETSFKIHRIENNLTEVVNQTVDRTTNSTVLNIVLFRQGVWINALLILTGYCILLKRKIGWMSLPIWSNIFSLLLSMGSQHARYTWFISVSTCIFILAVLVDAEKIRMRNEFTLEKGEQ